MFELHLDKKEQMFYTNNQDKAKDLSKSYKRCWRTSDRTGLPTYTQIQNRKRLELEEQNCS